MKPLSAVLGVVTGAMVATLSNAALAADFSFRGTFAQDDDIHLFDFSVTQESTVTFRTYSYGGGTQADGTVIAAGGFDPILSLFDANGTLIGLSDDDESGRVAADPTTGQTYDSLLDIMLGIGDYTIALTQYGNFTNTTNLADGFRHTGNGNFTSDLSSCTTDSLFCDFTGDVRTNQWAFDALGIVPLREPDEGKPPVKPSNPTQVPEPATTVAFALAGFGALFSRKKK